VIINKIVTIDKKRNPRIIDVVNIFSGDGEKLLSFSPTPIKSLKTLIKNYSS
tara:strand:- start:5989 stop:6144 length:156 start_codon:yes stop_codon:yes gene_type:complete